MVFLEEVLQAFTVFAGRQMLIGNVFPAGDTPHITVSLTPLPVRKRRRKHSGTSHIAQIVCRMPGSKRRRKHIVSRRIKRRRRRTRRRTNTSRRGDRKVRISMEARGLA